MFNFIQFFILTSVAAFSAPAYFTDKVDSTPNICQSCFPEIVRWKGKPHCAPAAVSNSMVWLAHNGFPELQPFSSTDTMSDHAKLVDKLGEVMNTTETAGTSPTKVFSGLKKYFEDKKVKYKRMASVGWRGVPDFVAKDNQKVSLEWIKEGILGKGSVWILIGWCKFDVLKKNCKIYDGHWMTVVGYGKDRTGKVDPNILIVNDPAERAERKNYFPTLKVCAEGFIDDQIPANEVLSLQGDVVIKPGSDLGVIQGAYRLEL